MLLRKNQDNIDIESWIIRVRHRPAYLRRTDPGEKKGLISEALLSRTKSV